MSDIITSTKRFLDDLNDILKHSPITKQEYDEAMDRIDAGAESGYYVTYAKEAIKMLKKKTKSTDTLAKKLIEECEEMMGQRRGIRSEKSAIEQEYRQLYKRESIEDRISKYLNIELSEDNVALKRQADALKKKRKDLADKIKKSKDADEIAKYREEREIILIKLQRMGYAAQKSGGRDGGAGMNKDQQKDWEKKSKKVDDYK